MANGAQLAIHDRYVQDLPSHQNAIDLAQGWCCAFPEELGLSAGPAHLHSDVRVAWGLEQIGDTTGMKMLELGPLEGSHTFMLCNSPQGVPASVLSIEANTSAFTRCLIAKNILGMNQATFVLGDFYQYLNETSETFDFILASGVLYHMADPLGLLKAISKRTNRIFIWTHYYDKDLISSTSASHPAFSGNTVIRTIDGQDFVQYERGYVDAAATAQFSGGIVPRHFWLGRSDILRALTLFGFGEVRVFMETLGHIHGPAFCLYAEKTDLG